MIERIASHFKGRFMQGYVKGKLKGDPVFAAAWEILRDTDQPLIDLGCGVGLLAYYLREHGFRPPITGLDFDSRKIDTAQKVGALYDHLVFEQGDASIPRAFSGNVTIIDVLHYLEVEQQQALLQQAAQMVAPGGLCLIRATPYVDNWRFRMTKLEEWFIAKIRWMKFSTKHYLRIEEITAPFKAAGFEVEVRPLWGNTVFNSYLFLFRRPVK
ncbi:MAG: class I SAM-dependent methyltransferase [Chthoniobacteraceae bacterium]